MTHPPGSGSGTPDMASLLARVQPEPIPDSKADSKPADSKATPTAAVEARPVAAGLNGKPPTTSTTSTGSPSGASPADGTTKGVPVKRLLVWAVPLVFLVAGAALMHQSQTAGTIFLLLALVALIVVVIAKWLGKRRAAASGGSGPKGSDRGPRAGRGPGDSRGSGGGRGGLLSKLNPFNKRTPAGGPGSAAGGRAPAGGKPPTGGKPPVGGRGMPGGKGGVLGRLNPFSKSGNKPGAAGPPGSNPGGKAPAGGKAPTGAPAGPKGLVGKLRNLLGGASPSHRGGGKSPAGGRAPSGGKTPGGPGGSGGPGAAGGGNRGFLRGLLGAKPPARPPAKTPSGGSPSGAPERGGSGGGRFGWFRDRLGRFSGGPRARGNPNHWRNSSARWERRWRPFRRGSAVPRDVAVGDSARTPLRDPADPNNRSGRWHTRDGSGYRGGGQREPFATPTSGGGPHQNPDGSYDAEMVDDHTPPGPTVKAHAERVDQPAGDTGPRPLAPAPTGLGPATNTSSTEPSGGNTMAHTDQQTGARSASVLEAGAATARAGAARKENTAATHRRQAAAVSGMPEMADAAANLRAQAARATTDAGARRGIAAAFSQAAAGHRSS